MSIPIVKQLQNKELRFIPLKEKSKHPVEEGWTKGNVYPISDKKFKNHKGNIGLVMGYGNVVVVDVDDEKHIEEIKQSLPKTFSVKTNRGEHFYFKCGDNFEKSYFEIKRDGKKIGELRVKNCFVLIPNCVHPEGKTYKVKDNIPINNITREELFEVFNLIDNDSFIQSIIENQEDIDKEFIERKIIPYLNDDIIDLIKTERRKGEIDRSARDQRVINNLMLKGFGNYINSIFENYFIGNKYNEHSNPKTYLEHSITEARKYTGVVNDDAKKLQNKINKTDREILKNKTQYFIKKISEVSSDWFEQEILLGLISKKTNINIISLKKRLEELEEKPIVLKSAEDILNKDYPEVEYYLYPLIPKGQLIFIAGKPASFKSLFTLSQLV